MKVTSNFKHRTMPSKNGHGTVSEGGVFALHSVGAEFNDTKTGELVYTICHDFSGGGVFVRCVETKHVYLLSPQDLVDLAESSGATEKEWQG